VMVKWYAWAAEYPRTLLESHRGQGTEAKASAMYQQRARRATVLTPTVVPPALLD
jgi:hypothetical protein